MTTAPVENPAAHVRAALEALGEPYEELAVDPQYADTESFCEHYGIAPEISANAIIVASKRGEPRYAACVLLATTRLDVNRVVRRLLEVRKASFASAEQTHELTGMLIGGVTPFGLPEDLPIYIDERVMALDAIWVGGGDRSSKIRVSPSVFDRISAATVVPDLAREV